MDAISICRKYMISMRNRYVPILSTLVQLRKLPRSYSEAKYTNAAKNGAYSKSVSSFGTFVPIFSSEWFTYRLLSKGLRATHRDLYPRMIVAHCLLAMQLHNTRYIFISLYNIELLSKVHVACMTQTYFASCLIPYIY